MSKTTHPSLEEAFLVLPLSRWRQQHPWWVPTSVHFTKTTIIAGTLLPLHLYKLSLTRPLRASRFVRASSAGSTILLPLPCWTQNSVTLLLILFRTLRPLLDPFGLLRWHFYLYIYIQSWHSILSFWTCLLYSQNEGQARNCPPSYNTPRTTTGCDKEEDCDISASLDLLWSKDTAFSTGKAKGCSSVILHGKQGKLGTET